MIGDKECVKVVELGLILASDVGASLLGAITVAEFCGRMISAGRGGLDARV